MKTRIGLLAALVFGFTSTTNAQEDRHELGRRVIQFEKEFEKQIDSVESRKRVQVPLSQAVQAFFSMNLARTSELLTEAEFALRNEKPTAEQLWGSALRVYPKRRMLDSNDDSFEVVIKPYYDSKQAVPEKYNLVFRANSLQEYTSPGPFSLTEPETIPFNSERTEADWSGILTFEAKGNAISRRDLRISTVHRLKERLDALGKSTREFEAKGIKTLEAKTLRHLLDILKNLSQGDTEETDYPAARLMTEMEDVAKAIRSNERYYGPQRAGQFWLSIPIELTSWAVRLRVPEGFVQDKPIPLVIALHGVGGSENMFFDSCGAGCCVRECEKRGWMMVAARAGYGTPAVAEIVAELAKSYPIDPKRIYIVGHSMGAGHAIGLVQQKPDLYAAVACLGGAGRITKPEAFIKLPTFIGIGKEDFAYGGAKALATNLTNLKAEKVVYRDYDDVEHLAIVQVAIRDLFGFFEKASK